MNISYIDASKRSTTTARGGMARSAGKAALALALSLGGLGCGGDVPDEPISVAASAMNAPVELGEPATALIRYYPGPTMRASSTLVAPNVVLSNAHATWGPASDMYVQFGAYTFAGAGIPAIDKQWHPGHVVGTINPYDVAVMRLACQLPDVAPVTLNRSPMGCGDIGIPVKEVGFGPTSWSGTDWGTKRSMTQPLNSYSSFWLGPAYIPVAPGDSGGSMFGTPTKVYCPGDLDPSGLPEGLGGNWEEEELLGIEDGVGDRDIGSAPSERTAIYAKKRSLIGIITLSGGSAIRVDRHAAWIQSWIDAWADPGAPFAPYEPIAVEDYPPGICPDSSYAGHYTIANPEPGVTYTWSAIGASVSGSPGADAFIGPGTLTPFTVQVTATNAEGCARTWQREFQPVKCVANPL
jgi:hypothetical protein